jgi:hypothetical protein
MTRVTSFTSAAMLLAIAAALPRAAAAQSPAEPWQFRAQLYLWLPGVSGQTNFPPPAGGGAGASVDLGDYFALSNLQSVFMGTLEARKGRWGAFTDFLYVDFDQSKSGTRDLSISTGPGGIIQIPVDASADVDMRLRGKEWTLAGTYAAIQSPQYQLQVLAGVRYLQIEPRLDWRLSGNLATLPPQSATGSLSVKPSYWDAIVGARGRAKLGEAGWFVPYHADIGTGDSRLTWQAVVGVGYAIQSVEIVGGYRYIGYDFKSGSPVTRLTFSGPAISVAYTW